MCVCVCVCLCYPAGVLDSGGSDFEDGEEVFDAIGDFLQEVCDKNEDDIREICFQMFNTLQLYVTQHKSVVYDVHDLSKNCA